MKKALANLALVLGLSMNLNAGMVDALAITVNNEPITLFDIDERMQRANVSKNEAVSQLIDEILYKEELKKNNISVDYLDVNNYIENLAARNGMDVIEFKSVIRQRYSNYERFEEEVKERLRREKLTAKLVQSNLKPATEEDMKIYYEKNYTEFNSATEFDVVQYFSKNRGSLVDISQNPMIMKSDVVRKADTLKASGLNNQIKYLLNSTEEKSFTPIFNINSQYVLIYINSKENYQTRSFDEVKNEIFVQIMSQREKQFLKEYFEKTKIKAKIEVIR